MSGAGPLRSRAFALASEIRKRCHPADRLPAQLWNFIPKAFKGYQNIPDPAEIQRRAQAELPLTKVYGDWTVSSDPKAHLQTIQSLLASGVTIVNIHSAQPDQKAVIDFYSKEVLPRVKARTQSP